MADLFVRSACVSMKPAPVARCRTAAQRPEASGSIGLGSRAAWPPLPQSRRSRARGAGSAAFESLMDELLPNSSGGRGLRVVVVEDIDDAREMLVLLLGQWGHQVRSASTAGEALELIREAPPDVAIVDLGLPDFDGRELARRLRAEEHLSDTVLLSLSGSGRPEDREASRESGFQRHLTKPVDPATLKQVLDALSDGD